MKPYTLTLAAFCVLCAVSLAGTEQYSGKEMKQVAPPPCPEWYSDTEWNISIWGAYAFSGTENNRTDKEEADDFNNFGTYDRFLSEDHAWGGGGDVKYFFHRYFGIGIEGLALSGRNKREVYDHFPDEANEEFYTIDNHLVGGVLGTLTLRYPFHCSRFSPYVWAGGGGLFGGVNNRNQGGFVNESNVNQSHNIEENRAVGQFGGGLEIRITPHIGITGDFSWNVVDGPNNNFGMVRSGLNFSF